jgi:dTDP-3-amino-3,4,6-trideoxy-alpha-D-glucose transaminase
VLVDIDAETLTLDPGALASAFTSRTKAIVPVHLYGHPCDMDPILAFASEHKGAVVEDCAQAHGTLYKGKPCGTFGHAAAFSFYPSKNLGAYGDAGCVVTNDEGVAHNVRMLRNYGEEKRYYHTVQGFNSRLDELQAAILRVKLRHLDEANNARRERAATYEKGLAGLSLKTPVEASWARHNYHLYVIRSNRRDALHAYLKEREIGSLIHYPIPIHLQGAYAELGQQRGAFPIAETACDTVLSLPMYPELPMDAVAQVVDAVRAFEDSKSTG